MGITIVALEIRVVSHYRKDSCKSSPQFLGLA